jgi:hypothetical protein
MEKKAKIELDERLAHLSQSEINALINRYYANEKAKLLVEEYKINVNPSKLYTIFPPIICEDKVCPCCGNYMLIKRTSKSSYSYGINTAYCINCRHEDSSFCHCTYCEDKRKILKLKKQEEEKKLIQVKKEKIYNTYNIENWKMFDYDSLSFRQKVYLGALLRLALSEDMKTIMSLQYIEQKLAPTMEYTKEVLRNLTASNIIVVNPDSSIDAFVESPEEAEFPNVYYISKVSYVLNVNFGANEEDKIREVIYPSEIKDEDKEEALKLWKEIALEECLEYLHFQMNKVKFDFSVGEKTISVFKDLLEYFSVSQIYGIIYRGVANATKYYQESNISKKQAANSVIGNCQRYAERALLERWELNKYHRAYELPQSMVSEIFFNRITKIGSLGFDMPPITL